jgi:hypothetical protein
MTALQPATLADVRAGLRALVTGQRPIYIGHVLGSALGSLRFGDMDEARAHAARARALASGWYQQVLAVCDDVDECATAREATR